MDVDHGLFIAVSLKLSVRRDSLAKIKQLQNEHLRNKTKTLTSLPSGLSFLDFLSCHTSETVLRHTGPSRVPEPRGPEQSHCPPPSALF